MECKSRFSSQYVQDAETYPAQILFSSSNRSADPSALTQLLRHFLEYGPLLLTLIKLYVQGRVLIAQNYVVSCRLRMLDVTFFYCRIQIFFMRLSHGFPLDQCWPRK
jgi:hypothetical protein